MTINSVLFDFDSSVVKPEAAIMLKQNTNESIVIEGYTCSVGPEHYNLSLSERRVIAIRAALVDQGIEESRLTAKGLGEADPVADNTTKDGRDLNRRVEFQVMQ